MTSDTQVYMDVPAVRDIAKTLNTISEILTNVARVLEVLIFTLKTTAFIGLVGGYAVAQFLELIKPYIEKMAEKLAEISRDVDASVTAYESGDAQGATRFY
jgi:hypothetical protein